jgi:LysR family transcriptional regulator, hydrogen peroxide-inducible genes activator
VTLRELRYLIAVANAGHFGRAAALCGVSQPSLSAQVRKLEDQLGVRVFERTSRRVMPTPEGLEIVAQARVVLDEAGKLQELARSAQDPLAGPLRLGAIPTLGPYLLPHLLPPIREAYPALRLKIREDLTATLVERLRGGALDAALLSLPVDGPGLEAAPLFREPFWAALPPGHRLARAAQISEADLRDEPLLLLRDGHCLRAQALSLCPLVQEKADGQDDAFQAASLETLRYMVAAGAGCTLLPALAVSLALARGDRLIELRPFAPPAPGRTIGLVWRRSSPRSRGFRALAALIRGCPPPGVETASA